MQGTRTMLSPARAVLLVPFRFVLFVALLLKVLLRKLILGVVLVIRAAGRNAVASIVVFLLLVALVAVSVLGRPTGSNPLAATSGRPGLTPSKAVEAYVEGYIKGDATLMWAAMGDDFRRSVADRGGSAQQLQQSLNQARQSGRTFRDAQYVFGKQLGDGRAVYLYILTAESPSSETREIPYTFTVNTDGKIESVD